LAALRENSWIEDCLTPSREAAKKGKNAKALFSLLRLFAAELNSVAAGPDSKSFGPQKGARGAKTGNANASEAIGRSFAAWRLCVRIPGSKTVSRQAAKPQRKPEREGLFFASFAPFRGQRDRKRRRFRIGCRSLAAKRRKRRKKMRHDSERIRDYRNSALPLRLGVRIHLMLSRSGAEPTP
jgi:hypothetical protein